MRGDFDSYWINYELKKSCKTSKAAFSHKDLSDVDESDFFFKKLKVLQMSSPNISMLAFKILEFNKTANCYSNVSIAYRILLTIPVTLTIVERSFSNEIINTILSKRNISTGWRTFEKNRL
jgi:hypothetical protein